MPGPGERYRWHTLADVIVDAAGRYVLADRNGSVGVTCLDRNLIEAWHDQTLGLDSVEARLAAAPDGKILAWQPGRHSAHVLSREGERIGTLGARERATTLVPELEVTDADDLIPDDDGTYLLIVFRRLVRFGGDGVGEHTWPQTGLRSILHDRLTPLYVHENETERAPDIAPRNLVEWGRRPRTLAGHGIRGAIARGDLYLVGRRAVGRFARDGRCLWSVDVPELVPVRPVIDGAGRVYVITETGVHVIADRKVDKLHDHVPRRLTALPDGTIGLWDSDGEISLLGPID